ncbi:MAG: hypothetical protein JKY56_08340 [Kofleriaceae bacterium]|nr:hypothetical protein [Kofleriaceae bacterium]
MLPSAVQSYVLFAVLAIVVTLTLSACEQGGQCIEVQSECNPLYQPTFDEVFSRTLKPGCAIAGSCHSGPQAQAGLRMDEADEAYRLLVTQGRLLPGDPSCSLLTRRLVGSGGGVMPPGAMLSDNERCAIEKWIADGAKR